MAEGNAAGGTGQTGRDPRPALAGFYAAQFGHLGIVVPFLPLWLASRGFDAAAIGTLLALPALFKIASPWLWGRWADRTGSRRELLIVAALSAALSLAALVALPTVGALVAGFAVYGFSRAALLPFAEATALEQSLARGFAYGPIRLWGSVTFIVASLGIGASAGDMAPDAGLLVAAGCLGLATLAAARFPAPIHGALPEGPSGSEPIELPRGHRALFFLGCASMQASHGAYYAFYSIRLQDLGFGGAAIGAFWAFGVACEIALFTRLDRWVDRLGVRRVLLGSLFLAVVRWTIIGTAESAGWLIVGQTFHAATYAAFHVASIRVVFRIYGRERARGQAMFSGMTYGLGMFVGSLAAGWLAEPLGLPGLFLASAAMAGLGLFVLSGLQLPRSKFRPARP